MPSKLTLGLVLHYRIQMSSTGISLSDKTVVISGPFGLLTQALTQALTECGADVALLVDDNKSAQRFCQNISDLREMSERYGRAAALESNPKNEKEAQIDMSRCSELFGTTDIYIDTHMFSAKLPYFAEDTAKAEAVFEAASQKSYLMSQGALFYLRSRHKSRIIYVFNELDQVALEKAGSTKINEFREHVKKMATETIKDHITFNALAIGISEEFLLSRFGNGSIQSSLKKVQETLPQAKLVEYRDISNLITFMSSPLSNALNGQILRLNHGLV
jgi:2-hydroxycyclohexanecarboxyl-CoA dehydrogenase